MELFHLTVSHSIEFESYIFQFQGFFSIEVADTIDLYTLQIRGCDIERQVLNVFYILLLIFDNQCFSFYRYFCFIDIFKRTFHPTGISIGLSENNVTYRPQIDSGKFAYFTIFTHILCPKRAKGYT